MAITTRDGIIDGLGNRLSNVVIEKGSPTNLGLDQWQSLWRATPSPPQGAIPGAAAVCDNALTGGMAIAQQTAPAKSYLAWARLLSSSSASMGVEFHDRLAHMGGLSGTVTTAQTVGVDVNGSGSNMAVRRGAADYSEVLWWVEWYTDTGSTSVNITLAVTYDDGSTGNVVLTAIGATVKQSRMLPVLSAVAGRYIRSIETLTLSATTGTAGNFGVTATRPVSGMTTFASNRAEIANWADLGFPEVPQSACVAIVALTGNTANYTLRGRAKVAHG